MTSAAAVRVLVVDDEPLARRGIVARLARRTDFELVGECADGRDAVDKIEVLRPDLVFLDVEMPGTGGFGVVEAIGVNPMPVVVFVTAYDQHAIRAFDANALDYLLKPIDDERFESTLDRVRLRVAERRQSEIGRQLSRAFMDAGAGAQEGKAFGAPAPVVFAGHFLVKRSGRVIVVPAAEIDWIEAAGDYVQLHCGKAAHLLRETMATVESRLDPQRFVRIHRSTIVNISCVREFHPHFNREYVVVLQDGTRLKLSRGYRDGLKRHFGGAL